MSNTPPIRSNNPATFGKALGDPGYEGRADFNRDNVVGSGDFNLLRTNFGQGGASLTCP